jgi:23S rRNA (cytidine1920-2'-O)/16S rRNA (cytidine1409-2'-O)-methyltransferase
VIERFNARRLTLADLPAAVDLVVVDVSFISLRHILPVIPPVLRPGGDVVVLVKPQFEAGRGDAPKGVVRDQAVRDRVVHDIVGAAAEVGLAHVATTASPITGQEGNVEFLVHLRPAG